MPTTYSPQFKSAVVDWLTGRNTTTYNHQPVYVLFYNGVQPADPSVTPPGTCAVSSYSYAPNLSNAMSAASGGVSALVSPRASSYNGTVTCPNVTFARLTTNSGGAVIDTPVSLAGGGGGVITDILAVSGGTAYNVTAFSVKIPLGTGTMKLNQALANRLAENISGANTTVPAVLTSANLYLYSGTPPDAADMAASGTLLATFPLSATSPWNTAVSGAAPLSATLTVNASGNGTVGYFRAVKGTFTLQGTAGTSGTDLIVDAASTTSGQPISVTAGTIAFG